MNVWTFSKLLINDQLLINTKTINKRGKKKK